MNKKYTSFVFFLQIMILPVKTNEIPIHKLHHIGQNIRPYPIIKSSERNNEQNCFYNNKWVECPAVNKYYNVINSIIKKTIQVKKLHLSNARRHNRIRELNMKSLFTDAHPVHRIYTTNPLGIVHIRPLMDLQGRHSAKTYQMHRPEYPNANYFNEVPGLENKYNLNHALTTPHPHPHASSGLSSAVQSNQVISSSNVAYNQLPSKPSVAMGVSTVTQQIMAHTNKSSFEKFTQSLDKFERQFYLTTFTKLTNISPVDRQENGMSFVQSGFFLLLTLMVLSKEVDQKTRAEIDHCIGFKVSDMDSIGLVRHLMTTLPSSSDKLKLRRSSRLMLWPGWEVSSRFRMGGAAALMLHIDKFNGTETSEKIATILNKKVEMDSGGAIHDTFDEDDVSGGVTAALVTTLYVRACWRTAPTVLNGTRPFRDAGDAPKRTVRMIRINDIMKYTDLIDWNAQALEISYATPGLTLLMLIPRGNSLRSLVQHVSNTSIEEITAKMRTMRVAATVPLYTLRMTLLLPNKLQAMGIPSILVDTSNITEVSSMKLSHAVQRIMFWAEAGRNAYKDDGIEWDQSPDFEVVVDTPYIFFVRWRNLTLINGNFVL